MILGGLPMNEIIAFRVQNMNMIINKVDIFRTKGGPLLYEES